MCVHCGIIQEGILPFPCKTITCRIETGAKEVIKVQALSTNQWVVQLVQPDKQPCTHWLSSSAPADFWL
jgi:hypothetical protein